MSFQILNKVDSYFFVPGTRLHKIQDIKNLGVTDIIIDLEDAVKFSERMKLLGNLMEYSSLKNCYVRVPLYNDKEKLDLSILNKLIVSGFTKFVLPKIESKKHFKKIVKNIDSNAIKIIILVETSRLFLEIKDVLFDYKEFLTGLGIGSHDLMAEIGGIHNLQNLEFLRQHLLLYARSVNVLAIDIASMELKNKTDFQSEILDGVKKGYDAKFYIHPWQLEQLKELNLYSKDEYKWAKRIKKELNKVLNEKEFSPTVIEGQVIERPHLKKVNKILKYYENK